MTNKNGKMNPLSSISFWKLKWLNYSQRHKISILTSAKRFREVILTTSGKLNVKLLLWLRLTKALNQIILKLSKHSTELFVQTRAANYSRCLLFSYGIDKFKTGNVKIKVVTRNRKFSEINQIKGQINLSTDSNQVLFIYNLKKFKRSIFKF